MRSRKLKVESKKSPLERRRFCPYSIEANWKQNQRCVKSLLIGFCCLLLFSCGTDEPKNTELPLNDSTKIQTNIADPQIIEPVVDEKIVVLKSNGIRLTEIKATNNKDATINLNTKQFNEGENHLSFSVSGVHDYNISYLANNYSLSQFSSDVFDVELMYGNNVFLAFLTDATGVSIKTNKGSVLRNAVLGEVESLFDMNQPHLFYHLPQTETNEPILDFYLVNTSISATGNKVKVTINGVEFILNKWAAYKISGLKKLANTVRIQLLDNNGNLIKGPFNDSGEKNFNFKKVAI